jgi:oligoribonuclease NrnB/cAMP/cGMP phosphodiesterase (DHH superfamily)
MYHSADHDGHASAAIIQKHLKFETTQEPILYPINHGEEIKWEMFDKNTTVWMADFSLCGKEFVKLLDSVGLFVWIDHHETPIKDAIKMDPRFESLPGKRVYGNKFSGCELAWQYCFGSEPMPSFIHRWGRFDVWDHSDEKTWDDVYEPFELGTQRFDTDPKSNPAFWERLFSEGQYGPQGDTKWDVIEKGRAIQHYVAEESRKAMASAYEIEFEGMTCLALNTKSKGSQQFGELLKKYPVCLTYRYDGQDDQWVVGVYSDNVKGKVYETPPVDVSKIAAKYGGGGHGGAAGFQLKSITELREFFFQGRQ